MNKLVSVVVTCYNHEQYIQQCLESILNQTYTNIELFIYNDGSTDSSDDVIRQTINGFDNFPVQYINQQNIGLSRTRNQAFDVIKGEYLLYVDSDNFLEENYIGALVQVAETKQADIVYATLKDADTGQVLHQAREFILRDFYADNHIDSCSLIRVEKVKIARFDKEYQKLEDYDFFFQLIVRNGANPVPCYDTFLNYRVLQDSMSARGDMAKYYNAYSRVIAKNAFAHPDFAEEALKLNFARLNVDRIYDQQKVTLYGINNEEDSIYELSSYDLKITDSITIEIGQDISEIRVDLSELPSFYKTVVLKDEAGKELKSHHTNGVLVGNSVYFSENDPQLYYRLNDNKQQVLQLFYERFDIHNVLSEDYPTRILVDQIRSHQIELRELKQQLSLINDERNKLSQELEQIRNSRRWRYTTKLINFFRRNK